MSVITTSTSSSSLTNEATSAVDEFIQDHLATVDTAVWYATTSNEGDQSDLALGMLRNVLAVQAHRLREGENVTMTYFQGLQAMVDQAVLEVRAHVYSQADLDHFAHEWMSAQDDRDAAIRMVRDNAADALLRAISASL